ncbi:MAG: sensor histidine kinase [Deltaproteobacteria bacterium]|nr:sensor histidine kinase [Deltaproteobacteria bacterium]
MGRTVKVKWFGGMMALGLVALWLGASVPSVEPSPAQSVLSLESISQSYSLPTVMAYMEDTQGQLTPEQALLRFQQGAGFHPLPGRSLGFGLSNTAYWVGGRVVNRTAETRWAAAAEFVFIEQFDMYLFRRGQTTGEHLPWNTGPRTGDLSNLHFKPVFFFSLAPGEEALVMFRLRNPGGAVQTPLELMSEPLHDRDEMLFLLGLGLFFGVLGALGLYNLFLYFSLRDSNYLLYVGAVIASSLMQAEMLGVAQGLLLPGVSFRGHGLLLQTSGALGMVLLLAFLAQFLQIRRHSPRTFRVVVGMAAVEGGLVVAFLANNLLEAGWDPILVPFSQFMALSYFGITLWVSLARILAGDVAARYFLVAQICLVGGMAIFLFTVMGLLPSTLWANHSMQGGQAMEMVLFALALGHRMRITQRERETARAEALANLKKAVQGIYDYENLAAAKQKVEEAMRMKDRFVALVAHDIRAPISTIMTLAETLKLDSNPLSPQQEEIVEWMNLRGRNFLKMADDLLRLNQIQTGAEKPRRELFPLWNMAEEIMLMNVLANAKGIRLVNQVPPAAQGWGDPTLMREVVQNLVVNAIKFCRAGDTITLGMKGDHTLTVADTGPGILPEFLPDLFRADKKTTTPGSAGETGTGLGLPLAREMMQLQGGELRVESTEGRGVVFEVNLPPGPSPS